MNEVTIPQFYKNKNVFITGGTGFMGKVLIEKLLRSCPDVNKIYMLIRSKKGLTIQERWDKLKELTLFDKLKSLNPSAIEKVHLVEGTIDQEDLMLAEEDKNLLTEEVDIIFHCAAAIQFTEDLVYSLKQNTLGTYNMANFATLMKNLKCFVYCSTAYSNCDKLNEIEEKIYHSNYDCNALLKLLSTYPKDLAILRDKILGNHPSTYTFTKALAEDVMTNFSQFYPIVVARPSLVLATVEEPIQGWSDILNGLSSTFLSVNVGLIRVLRATPTACLDYICADHAIKVLIISAWKVGIRNEMKGIEVLSCNYGKDLSVPIGDFFENSAKIRENFCTTKAIWYPFVLRISNPILYTIALFILQIIPSYIADIFLRFVGKKPRLTNITIKFVQAFDGPLKSFLFRQFLFPNDNFKNLNNLLHEEDKRDFSINFSHYNWFELFRINAISAASTFLKEDMSEGSIGKRLAHNSKLYKIHVTVVVMVLTMAAYILFKTLSLVLL